MAHALTRVNGRLAVGRVEAAAERLAVDGDDLAVRDFLKRCDPTQKARLEFRRFDRRQDRVEAIVRRDAVAQIEEPRESLAFLLPELRDGDKIIGSTNHRAHGDHHDINQRISHLANTRVGKIGEVLVKFGGLCYGHGTHSWVWRFLQLQPLLAGSENHNRPIIQNYPASRNRPSDQILRLVRLGPIPARHH